MSLPAAIVGRVFGVYEVHVWKIRLKAQKTARLDSRPSALSSEQESAINALIKIDIVMETLSIREIFLILSNSHLRNA
jgi:hypothetical protein